MTNISIYQHLYDGHPTRPFQRAGSPSLIETSHAYCAGSRDAQPHHSALAFLNST